MDMKHYFMTCLVSCLAAFGHVRVPTHHTSMVCLGPYPLVGEPSSQLLTAFPSAAVDDAAPLKVSTQQENRT